MNKLLSQFFKEHPEYFEGPPDARLLRGDLRPLFEEYAQAVDPSEYNELKKRVEAFQEQKRLDLKDEISKLIKDREMEEGHLAEIEGEIASFEKEVARMQRRLDSVIREPKGVQFSTGKSWYSSGYMFLFLDFLGVFFLYIGIILNERLTMSYVIMGILSIIMGFYFQQSGGTSSVPVTDPDLEQLKSDIHNKQAEIKQISKVRRISLTNRKNVALKKIGELNQKIETNLTRINEHYRE